MSLPGRTLMLVINDLLCREQRGIGKYGTTVDRTDLRRTDWMKHAYEEALDLAVYLRRLMGMEGIDVLDNDTLDAMGVVDCVVLSRSGVSERLGKPVITVKRDIIYGDPNTIAVYLRMLCHTDDDDFVTISTMSMSQAYGLTPKTIQQSIKRLVANGWVSVEGTGRGTRYRLIDVDRKPLNLV